MICAMCDTTGVQESGVRSQGTPRQRRLLGPEVAAAALLALILGSGAQAARSNPFVNVWNAPFASVSNGPQGAIVVEEGAPRTLALTDAATRQRRVRNAIAQQHSPRSFAQAVAAVRFMRQCGYKRRAQVRAPRLIVHTSNGRLILPDLDRVRQTDGKIGSQDNQITFTFEGWSTADEQAFRTYLDEAMPTARAIYGPPALNITVKVIQDDTLTELQGGTYDVTTNELRLPPMSGNFPEDTFVLMMLVLQAFHDDVALFYDSWEQGMAGAAATIVQTSPGVSPSYNPIDSSFYTLSVYEQGNQPQLGNNTWYTSSDFSGMYSFRVGQSRAAWMKCYVEDPQFFLRFNTQYYGKLNTLPAAQRADLPGDTPALLEICQSILPSVEGTPFISWYRQQYALDTSVTVGPKLFCWNVPVHSIEQSGESNGVILWVEYYDTDPIGGETPKGGTAELTYWNYNFQSALFANEGNEIFIPAVTDPAKGQTAGQGLLFPNFFNVGGAQRITVQMDLNGLGGRYPFAYDVRGFVEDPPGSGNYVNTHSIYGVIIGPNDGTVSVTGLGGLKDVKVEKGVWSGKLGTDNYLTPAQLQITFDDGNGNTVSRKVNVGYDTYGVLSPAGTRSGLAKNLPYGTNGLYLMSVPLWPIERDPARALGIASDKMMLARWKAAAPGGGSYEVYPTIDPMAPGLGYWLRVLSDTTIAVDGLLPSDSDDVTTQLYAGWNMIGCGRNRNVDLGELLVQRGASDSEPFADAITDGWVQAGLWAYSQQSGYELTQKLKPFEGYWLRCLLREGATLIFPAGSTTAKLAERTATLDSSPFGKTTWQATLVLDYGSRRSTATMGVAPSASDGLDARCDLQSPPAFDDQPTLRFVNKDWGPNAGEHASDFRGQNARGPWRLRVSAIPKGARARLRWPDLSQVPSQFRPVLIDRARGREVYMRTAGGYEFNGTGSPTDLEIVLRKEGAGTLAVTGLCGAQSRRGVVITYSLSADAAVSAHVMNLAGRPVRNLVLDKQQAAGPAILLWDLRSSAGSLVPNGTYLVQLTARSADGQATQAVSPVSVVR
jgi:hypothetical protein